MAVLLKGGRGHSCSVVTAAGLQHESHWHRHHQRHDGVCGAADVPHVTVLLLTCCCAALQVGSSVGANKERLEGAIREALAGAGIPVPDTGVYTATEAVASA